MLRTAMEAESEDVAPAMRTIRLARTTEDEAAAAKVALERTGARRKAAREELLKSVSPTRWRRTRSR